MIPALFIDQVDLHEHPYEDLVEPLHQATSLGVINRSGQFFFTTNH